MKRRKALNKNIFIFSIAALAIASVGFSSWIIGQVQGDKTISAKVEISGPTSNVFIGDLTYTEPDKELSLSFGNANEDKNIGIKEITTIVSENVIEASYDVSFSEATIQANKITATTNDLFNRISGTTYNYFAFQNGNESLSKDKTNFKLEIDLSKYEVVPSTNFREVKIEVADLNISYGSYFNFKNPQDFYDEKLDNLKKQYMSATGSDIASKKQIYIDALDKAVEELNTFVNAFKNQNIVIEIKGNYKFADGIGGKI